MTNCTESALRAAVAGGGTVTFACGGTILLAHTITNASDTSIDGSGYGVTISGNKAVRVFCVTTNVSFTAINLTIADGASLGGSAILNLGGTANLAGVSFLDHTATSQVTNDFLTQCAGGGAILNRGGTVNASNCSFADNNAQTPTPADQTTLQALVYGGAIRNEAGQVDLLSCAFVGNRASGGSGVPFGPPLPPGTGDPGYGGAIHNSGTMTLDLCAFEGNSASGGSASAFPFPNGLTGAAGSGGAIFNEGVLTVERTTLSGNTATGGNGGMGYCDEPAGGAGGDGGGANGGAICNLGSLWVGGSTFASNVVTGGSGGYGGCGTMSTNANGGSGGSGGSGLAGAVFNSGVAGLVNCTIAFNTGSGGGGGGGGSTAGMGDLGFGGAGGSGGSGVGDVEGTCGLTNCTVAWNVGTGGPGGGGGFGQRGNGAPGGDGTATWGVAACSTAVNTLIVSNTPAGNDTFAEPKLGPLADNGGPTLTMALLPGSPAIDAGNTSLAPATDQRGFPRPAGPAADIGAFEYGAMLPLLTISRSPGTGIDLLIFGNADRSCRLLSSMDLSNWQTLATNQLGAAGSASFHDNCSANETQRFYRVVMP